MISIKVSLEIKLLIIATSFLIAWLFTNYSSTYILSFMPDNAIKIDCSGVDTQKGLVQLSDCAKVKEILGGSEPIILVPKNTGTEQLAELWRKIYLRPDIYASDL